MATTFEMKDAELSPLIGMDTDFDRCGSTLVPAPYFRWSGGAQRILAAALLVVVWPVILLTMLLVRLTSPGPALFAQVRYGRNRRAFTLYKIRSMRVDAEAETGAVWTTSHRDARVTPLGQLLRFTHLDELPQLWNVVRGEMALVGPRPERPEIADVLADKIPGYWDRLLVLPGVTGLAQVNLPPDADVDDVRRKLVLDFEYIRHGSLSMDVRLFFCTLGRLAGIRSRSIRRVFHLDRRPEIDCDSSCDSQCMANV